MVAASWIVVTALVAGLLTWLLVTNRYAARLAAAVAERDALRERVADLEGSADAVVETAQLIAPLRESLTRVERQVHTLERDRSEQFAVVASGLAQVRDSAEGLRDQTASLVGSLSSANVRGAWGEVTLQRVLEASGMLARCDLDTQVSATSGSGRPIRPDVVVHLPGDRHVAVDAKAPMTDFLAAHADGVTGDERAARLRAHARALRGHVDALAAKDYWSAWPGSPELVIAFVPGEGFLAAALAADPGLHEHAMRRTVVLASPATLLAVLRAVALGWQQDSLAQGARELLSAGRELYARIGAVARHTETMGAGLRRSVEAYNALVGSMESRVLVTARRLHELGVVSDAQPAPSVAPLEVAPRSLSAAELVEALHRDALPPVGGVSPDADAGSAPPTQRAAG
ncbi:MAG TPA: DNA recombination protein RmuC [Dermatophilaceae bacterium]|nr:DNA recombination protein RmuC [Dermatophilaceae bacterium]